MRATSARFNLNVVQHEIQYTQNEELVSTRIIIRITLPVCLSIHQVQLNYTDDNGKELLACRYFSAFLQHTSVIQCMPP